ncbi:hypothetical protein BC829DRAFT_388286 [Chytridium lagenaria]|nr:hypothetical protein BC829DRAFT_388286 [Chytridium lagenaria]
MPAILSPLPGWFTCDIRTGDCDCLWSIWRGRGGVASGDPCVHVVAARWYEWEKAENSDGEEMDKESYENEKLCEDEIVNKARELAMEIRPGYIKKRILRRQVGIRVTEAEKVDNEAFLKDFKRLGDKIFHENRISDTTLSMEGQEYYWNH